MAENGIWIFAYGSLMWRPGFEFTGVGPALLRGYHRALCLYSIVYRGTPEKPGLVMGLDRGGSCRGLAYKVAAREAGAALAMLDERELATNAYRRKLLKVRLDGGKTVKAHAYVIIRDHAQYAGGLAQERVIEVLLQGHGPEGSSLDYLKNTVAHLDDLGIPDGPLHAILKKAILEKAEG
ncbi:MAG: gamma-glutamylcyclotransferase [Rhodospirillales bacterium]